MNRLVRGFILFVIVWNALIPINPAVAQPPLPPGVDLVFNAMSAEERVGQLFLVDLNGIDVGEGSKINDLIVNYHIGGVILTAANNNFTDSPNTIKAAYDLIARLQRVEWEDSNTRRADPITGEQVQHRYVPLFVGISQDGNGYPGDQIFTGLTPLPSQMAIGASWDTSLAEQAGEVQGRELSALGFNLLLSPSLDVLDTPNPTSSADLGPTVFGGDPFWVGEMGRAFVRGLHKGSEQRMLVVAKHFPGRGGTNRPSEAEIPTVRKSLEQLKQIELAPFFAMTGSAPSPEAAVDGLLVSHIRYQGLQGNIRATTRPISFDAQALDVILKLPQFSAWREAGGLIMSDDLGTRAVSQFYSPGSSAFSARDAVRDAFLAGNDLLYLGAIGTSEHEPDPHKTIAGILTFFAQKYREDPTFAHRVDDSVRRILTRKFGLYNSISIFNVTPPANEIDSLGISSDLVLNIADASATLISPDPQELALLLPSPPQVRDRLVFLTDRSTAPQCSSCPAQDYPAVNAFQHAVIRLYGPEAANQTSNFLVSSYTFEYLLAMLDGLSPPYIENDVKRADWIIISITSTGGNQPALVSRFLSERQDILRNRKIILFSFGAPYYFDSTDISRLTAYYALYSKQQPFIDVAARLLFQELKPAGSSPVSIPGTGYDLIFAMQPDPGQIIPLFLDFKSNVPPVESQVTPEPTPVPLFQIGDTIAIRTGPIEDHNGHIVPDGTVVQFSMTLTGEGGGILQEVDAVTSQGIARASFGLEKPGLLEIHAVSEPATISEVLQLDVSQSGPVAVTVVVPELTQSADLVTPSAPRSDYGSGLITREGYPGLSAWLLIMLMIAVSSGLSFWFFNRLAQPRTGLRLALGIMLGGLLAYNYLAFGLPGSTGLSLSYQMTGVALIVLAGELAGGVAGYIWSQFS